jgi:hypothetical protein
MLSIFFWELIKMSLCFTAKLSGRQEVPPVVTDAFGSAELEFSRNFKELHFKLVVNDLQGFTQAHIHLGIKGENGPVVAFLFGPVMPGIDVEKKVIKGTLTRLDLVGPLSGLPLSELAKHINAGNAYINAHTEDFPDGEIRGQIKN